MKRLIGVAVLGAILFGAAFGGAYYYERQGGEKLAGDVQAIAVAATGGLQEQGRLTPFVARLVAVVTTRGSEGAGFGATRTLLIPGLVRYGLDLKKIRTQNVTWNADLGMLGIMLPPLEVGAPQLDMQAVMIYGPNGAPTALADAEAVIEDATQGRSMAELARLARGEAPMRLARDAARAEVEAAFAMSLHAQGVKVGKITAKFADEEGAH